ncbi:TPA: ribonuclease T [Legionella pneumophila subsp. pneumophila]|uniref:ribonuclease T n=1 Tax=Legionella sp. PATHC039 TaxID=2992042 RepID=UPI001A315AE2|nr:ribonuclease T [Legionella sp. PATHC039]HAT8859244.1 ribonuclease T [Legionella pneumophila subsp. pneumophila]MCW8396405.1 ribonuclease T [Legionella sp. PATHC039]HAT8890008.1 ribonuclease T [Legionella pneumophila subsp. pneumophila]HAT9651062.1 ribonuclease T [Legionella pneumophila subsp. pneumophila]HAT9920150.1 ribonuclease T [Legionella pneumophila subsp. pneumophila]
MVSRNNILSSTIKNRFRGFLPVVVDVETAGIDPQKNALLEMCIVLLDMDEQGLLKKESSYFEHILPFPGAELDQKSLAFNQIDPYQPLRFAVDEQIALERLFKPINDLLKKTRCQRAVLVGHNAWFDLLFIKAAIKRTGIKSPFHAFTCFDTATLAGLIFGETVLAKAVQAAGLHFDSQEAHSAIYDAEKTADLFCLMINKWRMLNI